MVSKILVDSGNYGTIPSGSYSTVVLPNAGAVPFPTYIVSGSYSGSYVVAYWNGTTLSPVFNQNDPRCGTFSTVVRSVADETFYLFSFASAYGRYILTIFLIDSTEIKAGIFSPSTTKVYSLTLNGTPDVYSIYNVDKINSTTFFVRTTTECIILDLDAANTSVKRVSVASSAIRLNGYQPCALLQVSSGFAILDMAAGEVINVAGSSGLIPTIAHFWPTSDGYYYQYGHMDGAGVIVGYETYKRHLIGIPPDTYWSPWEYDSTTYVGSFLRYFLISYGGTLEDISSNSTIPCSEVIQWSEGTRENRYSNIPNPFSLSGARGCTGIGGNYTRVLTYFQTVRLYPIPGVLPGGAQNARSIVYDEFPALKDAADFVPPAHAYAALPAGSGASLADNYNTSQIGLADKHAPIINKYNNYILTGGSTIYELKPEINGYYTTPIGITPFAMCPI